MAAGWPKLADVRTFLRLQPDATEDTVIDNARTAAIDYGVQRTALRTYTTNADGTVTVTYESPWPSDTTTLPDALFNAALIDSAHLYRRRDSIDGTVAWGDMGAIRVSSKHDPDAETAYALYAPLVFG
jgi:hypothetical protein